MAVYVISFYVIEFFTDVVGNTLDDMEFYLTTSILFPIFTICVMAPLLVIANHAWMIFDGQNRGWHDVWAHTVVVRAQ